MEAPRSFSSALYVVWQLNSPRPHRRHARACATVLLPTVDRARPRPRRPTATVASVATAFSDVNDRCDRSVADVMVLAVVPPSGARRRSLQTFLLQNTVSASHYGGKTC